MARTGGSYRCDEEGGKARLIERTQDRKLGQVASVPAQPKTAAKPAAKNTKVITDASA